MIVPTAANGTFCRCYGCAPEPPPLPPPPCPRPAPSLSKQVYLHMSQMLDNGMTAERAADIIRRWSDGAGGPRARAGCQGRCWVSHHKEQQVCPNVRLLQQVHTRLPVGEAAVAAVQLQVQVSPALGASGL